jgi:hypothetical protein
MVARTVRSMTVRSMIAAVALFSLAACSESSATDPPPIPTPSPSPSLSAAQEIAWDRGAQAALRNSLAAALNFYTDAATYEGLDPGAIAEIEPSLAYLEGDRASSDDLTISIAVPTRAGGHVYGAAALSSSGRCFTIRDDRGEPEDETTYGVIHDGSACTGNAALSADADRWP